MVHAKQTVFRVCLGVNHFTLSDRNAGSAAVSGEPFLALGLLRFSVLA